MWFIFDFIFRRLKKSSTWRKLKFQVTGGWDVKVAFLPFLQDQPRVRGDSSQAGGRAPREPEELEEAGWTIQFWRSLHRYQPGKTSLAVDCIEIESEHVALLDTGGRMTFAFIFLQTAKAVDKEPCTWPLGVIRCRQLDLSWICTWTYLKEYSWNASVFWRFFCSRQKCIPFFFVWRNFRKSPKY